MITLYISVNKICSPTYASEHSQQCNIPGCKHSNQNLEWNWVGGQAGCSQDVECSRMSKSSPSHHINQRESSWIIGRCEESDFTAETVPGFFVCLIILLWQSSLGQGSAMEWKEHKPSQSQRCNRGTTDNKINIGDGLGHCASAPHCHWLGNNARSLSSHDWASHHSLHHHLSFIFFLLRWAWYT